MSDLREERLGRREFIRGAVALGASWVLIPGVAQAGRRPPKGIWLPGDLHCHTLYSFDVWNGPTSSESPEAAVRVGFKPADQIALAAARGLEFLAITDHDTVGHLRDVGYKSNYLVLVPGYEHSLHHGHAGLLGVRRRFRIDTTSTSGLTRLRDAVHRSGGLMIVNHPRAQRSSLRWRYTSHFRPDAVEVWNHLWAAEAVAPTIRWWSDRFLRAGRMPMVGGSDSHRASNVGTAGVGQPTTWVYARNRSSRAVLDAIKAGRTTVSLHPPAFGGPRLTLHAETNADRWMIGERIAPARSVTLKLRVLNGAGQRARLIVDGTPRAWKPITSSDMTLSTKATPRRHARAELAIADDEPITALTSPIYFG